MTNEKGHNVKRIAAGLMALSIVASPVILPANVSTGGLFGGITANAETLADDSVTIAVVSAPLTYNGGEQQLINDINVPQDYWENHELYIRIAKDGGETGT